jgi:hypothetical protein
MAEMFDEGRDPEIYFIRCAPIAVPCPACGGKVWFGTDYDWPPNLGGDPIEDRCVCAGCKREWTIFDAPDNFMTPDQESWNVTEERAPDC